MTIYHKVHHATAIIDTEGWAGPATLHRSVLLRRSFRDRGIADDAVASKFQTVGLQRPSPPIACSDMAW